MRAQVRTLTPIRSRQEKHGSRNLRCSQPLCAGAGLPDSRQSGNVGRTLPAHLGFRWDNTTGAASGGQSAPAAQQAVMQTGIRPSVAVDRSLEKGGMRWIDGTVEQVLRSAFLYPSMEHRAQSCAVVAGPQGEWPDVRRQADLPRIGQGVWSIGSFHKQTRRAGDSQAASSSPPTSGSGATRPLAEQGGEACHKAEGRAPSSVLPAGQGCAGRISRKAGAEWDERILLMEPRGLAPQWRTAPQALRG